MKRKTKLKIVGLVVIAAILGCLGGTFLTTKVSVEKVSTESDQDVFEVSNEEELQDILRQSEPEKVIVFLKKDVVISQSIVVARKNVVIEGNGHSLIFESIYRSSRSPWCFVTRASSVMTIRNLVFNDNDGTLKDDDPNEAYSVFTSRYSTLIMDNVTTKGNCSASGYGMVIYKKAAYDNSALNLQVYDFTY